MNDLTPYDGGPLPDRPARLDEAKAAGIRKSLDHIRRNYLAPFEALDRAMAEGAEKRKRMRTIPRFLVPEVMQPTHPATDDERAQQLAYFDARLDGQPSRMEMVALQADLAALRQARPNAKANRLIAGLMLGAFPNLRSSSPETYLEALVEALDQTGAPPAAVAKACNEIVRTCKFPPSVSEVAEKVAEIEGTLNCTIRQIDQYGRILDWAADVRTWLKNVPLLAEDRRNRERPPEAPSSWNYGPTTPGRVDWV